MADRNDWDEAFREVIVAARAKAGAPPTDEELLAYSRGELPEAAAARTREHLALHPELIRPLLETIPDLYRGELGDPDYLSDDQMEEDWARLEASLPTPVGTAAAVPAGGTVLPFRRALQAWRFSALAAALIACILGGLYLHTLGEFRQQKTPRLPERRILLPDGERGSRGSQPPIAVPLPSGAPEFLLLPSLADAPRYPRYRVDIVDLQDQPGKVIWSRNNAPRTREDTFEILVPRAFLGPGEYRIDVYGISGSRRELLSSYTVEIAPE
jgi:hypothetical protein